MLFPDCGDITLENVRKFSIEREGTVKTFVIKNLFMEEIAM